MLQYTDKLANAMKNGVLAAPDFKDVVERYGEAIKEEKLMVEATGKLAREFHDMVNELCGKGEFMGSFVESLKYQREAVEHDYLNEHHKLTLGALEGVVQTMMRADAPIIAVDFDGTLCESAWPEIGPAKEGVLAVLRGEQHRGARLILWTNRTGALLEDAVEWCRGRGLEFDAVNENLPEIIERYGTDSRKITADVYLDDKALAVGALNRWAETFCAMIWFGNDGEQSDDAEKGGEQV